jgi:CubicO group peptidase (beta-lactamase class C family)
MKQGILTSILIAAAASAVLLTGVHALEQHAAPESEGFSSERLARISPVMRAEIEKGTMPGAVTLIARHGKVVHVEAHGYLDSGKAKPMTTDAVFRLFSMTKPFVSVMAMMLVEQGQMKLSDSISTWIPELKDMKVLTEKKDAAGHVMREPAPMERPIAVQDLLRHTSASSTPTMRRSPSSRRRTPRPTSNHGRPTSLPMRWCSNSRPSPSRGSPACAGSMASRPTCWESSSSA